jgi:hypothetical protein
MIEPSKRTLMLGFIMGVLSALVLLVTAHWAGTQGIGTGQFPQDVEMRAASVRQGGIYYHRRHYYGGIHRGK